MLISVFRLIIYTAFSRSRPHSPHHTHTTYRPSNLPPPSSVHRMHHSTPTVTRPSLMPLGRTKTAQKGARSVRRCCVRRGRRSRRKRTPRRNRRRGRGRERRSWRSLIHRTRIKAKTVRRRREPRRSEVASLLAGKGNPAAKGESLIVRLPVEQFGESPLKMVARGMRIN